MKTVTAVNISNAGDIVTVDQTPKGSTLRLWGINGTLLAKNTCTEKVLCIAFSGGMEGISRNIVVTGLDSGWNVSLLMLQVISRYGMPGTLHFSFNWKGGTCHQ